MTKSLPDSFLMVTHEGLIKATISLEMIQNMDNLLSKFVVDKMSLAPRVAESPFGYQHVAVWSSSTTKSYAILELTKGQMVLSTEYLAFAKSEDNIAWVYPSFLHTEESFPLRCLFDFGVWHAAGLRLFLALNFTQASVFFWVYFDGQIYRPPFGNIFENTSQVCLGPNKEQHFSIFTAGQPGNVSLVKTVQLLNDSTWNHDTFHSKYSAILKSLVRFDSEKPELPMLPPLDPPLIKKSTVVTNKELADITSHIVAIYG